MYFADVLNANGLFQRFGSWRKQATSADQQVIDDLLFRGTAAALHLGRMKALREASMAEFRQFEHKLKCTGSRLVFWSPSLIQMVQEISPLFSTIRIAQNLLLPIVFRACGIKKSVPLSLADGISKLGHFELPNEICGKLERYWTESGVELRGYRDIDQHYATIVRHAFVTMPQRQLVVPLPDDPTVRSAMRFTFVQERDAVQFCLNAFLRLHATYDDVLGDFGYAPALLDQAIDTSMATDNECDTEHSIALYVIDSRINKAMEFGITSDRRPYVYTFPIRDQNIGSAMCEGDEGNGKTSTA